MRPNFDLDKIRYTVDAATFEKAVDLYESEKVTRFGEEAGTFSAVVLGTTPYRVSVEARRFGFGNCTCYLGQKDIFCKHMVAVSIQAVLQGKKLDKEEKKTFESPACSGRRGELDEEGLKNIKQKTSLALKHIKAYYGPSRTWFAYQDSLFEGCNRLSEIVSHLPVSEQTAKILVGLLLRLDKKLCTGGVDDSDGVVGGFIEETVVVLQKYSKIDPLCIKAFSILQNKETCFGWEEPLLKVK